VLGEAEPPSRPENAADLGEDGFRSRAQIAAWYVASTMAD
jgi:hypothetical protein